jgi:hypothetical protein
MIRKIALAGAAVAVGLAGVSALAGSASAAPPTINNATTINIQCNLLPTTAKLNPGLKNNWVAANHNGINDVGPAAAGADPVRQETGVGATWNDTETNATVKALPNTKFSSDVPNVIKSTSKTANCTGNVSQTGVGTYPVSSLKITLGNYTNGTDNPPLNTDNTCQGLLAGTPAGDVAATYKATIQPKLTGAKLSPTKFDTNGLALVAGGGGAIGFEISGGTSGAPFAGSNSKTTAYVAGSVLTTIGATPATSADTTQDSFGDDCEASLLLKPGKPAKLKGPKGFKKIAVGANILNPSQASNICIRKGSSC